MVERVFDQHLIAGIHEHLGAQAKCLLRAGEDQHPIGSRLRPPFEVEVVSDRAAQRRHALWRTVLQRLGAIFLVNLALQLLPGCQGKLPGLGNPRCERARPLEVVHAPALQHGHCSAAQVSWLIAEHLALALAPRQVPRAL
ncbi:hypothetical protein D3C79_875970 [compost metagenome]